MRGGWEVCREVGRDDPRFTGTTELCVGVSVCVCVISCGCCWTLVVCEASEAMREGAV